MAFGLGLWSIVTLYLYWQWFHYARQSWGVSQVYRRKAGGIPGDNLTVMQVCFYLLPLWGILHRSFQAPETFLSLPIKVLPVPGTAGGHRRHRRAGRRGLVRWPPACCCGGRDGCRWPTRSMCCRIILMFYVGYIVIDDITVGWVTVNIWHNAQYILFVWMFNNNRFKGGIEPQAKFLSYISQTKNAWVYFVACLGLSTTIYLPLSVSTAAVPTLMFMYQVINFHHYIANSIIWKVRRKSLQKTLGIS